MTAKATGFTRRTLGELGPRYGAPAALAALLLLNIALTPHFATTSNLWNVLLQVSTTMLVALGMTFVMGSGGIDLSVGSIVVLTSVVSVTQLGHGAGFAIAAGLGVSLAAGLLNGSLVARFGIQPFVVTLAMLIALRGLALVISRDGELLPFADPTFEWMGKGYLGPVPAQVAILGIAVAIAAFASRATVFARSLVAVGGNEAAARLAGVRVGQTKLAVYAISGVLAGLAGLIETARLGTTDASNMGSGMELDAIAATVVGGSIGGRISIFGTVVGALIMAIIMTSFNMHEIPYAWSLLVKAVIMVVAVYIQRPKVA